MTKTLSLFAVLGLSVFMVGCAQNSTALTPEIEIHKDADLHADYFIPDDLSILENRSDAILKVKSIGNVQVGVMKDIEGDVPETTNELKILEAYKGPFNSGDSVTVAEAFFLQDDQYVQIEGYTPLVEEREYILFIEEGLKDESGNLVYGISSLDFGKYSQEGEVASVDFTTFNNVNELSKYDFIKEDPHHNDLYNEIKKDVLRKYY